VCDFQSEWAILPFTPHPNVSRTRLDDEMAGERDRRIESCEDLDAYFSSQSCGQSALAIAAKERLRGLCIRPGTDPSSTMFLEGTQVEVQGFFKENSVHIPQTNRIHEEGKENAIVSHVHTSSAVRCFCVFSCSAQFFLRTFLSHISQNLCDISLHG